MKQPTRLGQSLIAGVIAGSLFLSLRGCTISLPHPGPAPDEAKATGTHVIALVDHTAPSIPLGLVITDNQMLALAVAGKYSIVGINEDFAKVKGYDQLLTASGGAPAMLILDAGGGKVYAGRFPTDAKARDALLKKYVTALPPPLPAPEKYPRVQDYGREGLVSGDRVNGFRLSAIPDKQKFAALPRYGASNPVFPVNEWHDINRRNVFGDPAHMFNQGQHGSCVGNGGAAALGKVRVLCGMKDVKLSAEYLYAQINGGRDEGAVISDIIEALKQFGTCPESMNPQGPSVKIYKQQLSAEMKAAAPEYKLIDAYRCDTWAETVSALQTGQYIAVFGVMVGNTWTRFDSYGVCGHDRGAGNHCLHADGCKKLPDGRWVLDTPNSWGYDWGPFKNGRCYLDEKHLFSNGDQADVCVIRIAGRSSKEPFDPPAYKPRAGDAEFPLAP